MNIQIAYERLVNVLASVLAMAAQRLPFLKNLTPVFGGAGNVNFAAPLTVTFVGTHSLSGQSIVIVPVNGGTNPAAATVGEQFVWGFRGDGEILESVKVEMGGVEAFPPGLSLSGLQDGIFFLAGIPSEGGNFDLKITGYRELDYGGYATIPYVLTVVVDPGEEPLTPFEEFVATFWSGDDLKEPLLVGPLADPDSDGIQNIMEFVLDLDPTKPESMPGTFGVDPEDPEKMLYQIPLNFGAGAIAVTFEEGSNLESGWKEVSSKNVTRTDVAVELRVPIEGKKFYRLKVLME